MTVERARVGDVLRLERREVTIDPVKEYRLIGVYSFGKGILHRDPRVGAELGNYRYFGIHAGDLVLSNIQAWEGAIALASDADAGTIGTHRFLTYRPSDGRIDTNWARWFFLSEPGMDLIRQAAPGTTMRNRTLAIQRFEDLEIPVPPIDEQRRVAPRLDLIHLHYEEVSRCLGRAREVADALGVSACARPDLAPEAKVGAGWRIQPLGEVMSPAKGRTSVQPDQAYANLGIYSFGRGVFEKPNIDGATTSATVLNRVQAGQFIYSRLFAFEGAYAYVPPAFDGYFVSNEFPSFDPDPDRLDARWLATYLRSAERWAELAGASKGLGVRRQRIPVEAILEYEVWLPPIDVQRSMVETIDAIDRSSQARAENTKRVSALVPAVLNEVFAGLS